jgi:thiol:disulfide interchange protein DsbD
MVRSRPLAFGVALLCAGRVRGYDTTIPHGALELIAEKQWIAAGHTIDVALRFQLEKGWHIYWVNPGDSGEPPRVDWRLPSGLNAGAIEWPAPLRFETSSTIVDYGYLDDVLLMVPVRADAKLAQPTAQLEAEVKVLICSHEMCIPGKAQVSLTLPIKSEPADLDARNAGLFAAARKSLPRPAPANLRHGI